MSYPQDTAEVMRSKGYFLVQDFECSDVDGGVTLDWYHADPKPTVDQVATWATEWQEQQIIADINREARQRIVSIADEDAQRNMLARATELQEKRLRLGTLTAEEQAETEAMQAVWGRVKAIRAAAKAMKENPQSYASPSDRDWPE